MIKIFLSHFLKIFRKSLRWCWRYGIALGLFSALLIALVPRSTVPVNDPFLSIAFDVSEVSFDFIQWEIKALQAKAAQAFSGEYSAIGEAERSDFVRQYMQDLGYVQQIEAQFDVAYQQVPLLDFPTLGQERATLRQSLVERQPTVEAILEEQVASILLEQGFGVNGALWPPMAMRFTQIPDLLVTSPRGVIRMETSLPLYAMPVAERARIEAQLEADYDLSALIVPLGGIAVYPAMIYETTSIPFAVETFAHEWLHHYLFFYPLGVSYFTGDVFAGDARIINETTADLFGKEIARLVLARYYPDLPMPALPTYDDNLLPVPVGFDFATEMNETRIRLDELLAQGRVADAEAYLEQRRLFFAENGYALRKLNQAYFAFYGGYQIGTGAGGADPIGQSVLAIRANSESIHEFVLHMRSITSRESLNTLQQRLAADT